MKIPTVDFDEPLSTAIAAEVPEFSGISRAAVNRLYRLDFGNISGTVNNASEQDEINLDQ